VSTSTAKARITVVTTAELVSCLRGLNVKLWIEGERLRCNAPRGVLTDALRDELAASKPQLLTWLREHGDVDAPVPEPATAAASAEQSPLSLAQQRIWFIAQMQPGDFAYNITTAIRMRGKLVVEALESAIGEVLKRHEALRAVFMTIDGQPMQRVTPVEPFRIPIVDLMQWHEDSRLHEADRRIGEEGRRPFELEKGPIFRAQLMRLALDDHLLQLTTHHIVCDGWSLGVFANELAAFYEMHVAGRSSPLSAPLPYAEIVRRQRERVQGPLLQRLERYWTGRLTPPPPVLELPADHARPAVQTFNGDFVTFTVDPGLTGRLQRLSREHDATLFMTLFAAFGVLLSRYTGVTDIAMGVPIANRKDLEEEAVIGLMMNTLVLRLDLSGDPTFEELLVRTRDLALDAYAHQDLPFARLVEVLKPPRDISHSVLFQVMFILQNVPSGAGARWPDLEVSDHPVSLGTAKTDLTLEVVEDQGGLGMFVEYNTDLFERETIRRLCGHLERLFGAIVENPAQPISRLPLLSDAERRRVTLEWNATEHIDTSQRTVPEMLQMQARRVPDAPAARYETRCLSYGELNSEVNRLAGHLRKLGSGPNVLTGIFVDRSLDMLVAILAVMKTGGVYVPLDPEYPVQRIEFMLEDAGVSLLVTKAPLLERICVPPSLLTVCLDRDANAIRAEPDQDAIGIASDEDAAYVIYTSGSTGRPKGVQIKHSSLTNVLAAFKSELNVVESDVLLALTTLSFDIAALELLLPLLAGAQVVIAPREVAIDPTRLAGLMDAAGASIVQATPTTWRVLLEAGWRNGKGLRILCGGEAFPAELVRPLLATGASVWNVYGPTETTIWSTTHRVNAADCPVPIGRPIFNTQVYVLDPNGEPTPIGVPGELYIGGGGVAKGYLNRPELNAERFVPDPFAADRGARLYRTGDIARFRADGSLEFLGRVDHQVKIRGFRIELGEIETVLVSHPAVAQAVVVGCKDRSGEGSLAAYARLTGTSSLTYSELRAFLAERLPVYMIPSSLTVLDAFPLTPNGKVDRGRLPEPRVQPTATAGPHLAPQSPNEQAIANVWRDVLQLDRIGVDDNFFDLGGHSLLVVRVQSKLREILGRAVSIIEMFQYPTVRAIAAHLEQQG
jgi:amino acid adenylation domain-containing protein